MERQKRTGRLVRTTAVLLMLALVATSVVVMAGMNGDGAGECDEEGPKDQLRTRDQVADCEGDGEQNQNQEQKRMGEGSGEQQQSQEQKREGEGSGEQQQNQEQKREGDGECEGDPVLTRAMNRYMNQDGEGPSEDSPMYQYMHRYMHQEQVTRL